MPARLSLEPVAVAAVLALALSVKVARADAPAPPASSTPSPPASAPPTSAPPASAPPASTEPPAPAPPAPAPPSDPLRPPPLHVEYAQYGAAITSLIPISQGALCGATVRPPCIIGGGGGLVIRGGYRSPGPWYVGGAYEFTKLDSGNLYRLGIFQDLRGEVRYTPDTGSRAAPYLLAGVGAAVYGNEWGVETGGALIMIGGGLEFEVSRLAHVGLSAFYRPVLLAGWTDTAKIVRPTGLAQFFGLEIQLEVRTEINRR